LNGFTKYKVDYVIKFGGSILSDYDVFKNIIKEIETLANEGVSFLIIPGGGPTDNTIEELDKYYKFQPSTHHRACAKAQDQTGLMISDKRISNKFEACESFEDVEVAIQNEMIPVLLPSEIIFMLNPFEKIWDITSDAMSAWFAWLIKCNELIVLTNVDGVFKDAQINDSNKLIEEISATILCEYGHTAIDACTAPFLKHNNINAWVLNAYFPNRLREAIYQSKTVGTRILGI